MEKFVVFDTNKILVSDKKDISQYVSESIRNIYGIITDVSLDRYEDLTAKEIVSEILKENGVSEVDINERLNRYLEDLPYSYYNVAWSDKIEVKEGAKQLLELLKKKEVKIGITTGESEKVAKMRLEKVNLEKYFSFNIGAEKGLTPSSILDATLDVVSSEYGLDSSEGIFFSASKRFIEAAHNLNIYCIGISNIHEKTNILINSGANEIISSLKERPKVLKSI